jgi:hypothetical protein
VGHPYGVPAVPLLFGAVLDAGCLQLERGVHGPGVGDVGERVAAGGHRLARWSRAGESSLRLVAAVCQGMARASEDVPSTRVDVLPFVNLC